MKKKFVFLLAVGILFLFFQSFRPELPEEEVFPEEITAILKTSCYDCHYTGASSEKALNALDFASWEDYRTIKQIGLLTDISKVVKEKKMPPGKYLEKKPEAGMNEKQIQVLAEWTEQEAEKLMQAN